MSSKNHDILTVQYTTMLLLVLSYWACRYSNLNTLNSKIRPLKQILEIDGEKSEEEQEEKQEDPIIIEEDMKRW